MRFLGSVMFAVMMAVASRGQAQVPEVRFAQQFSMGYLQFDVMRHQDLLQKHAAALGIPEVKVSYIVFNGPDMMNDALLSGAIDVASGGVPGLLTIWGKTNGTAQEVRGISAMSQQRVLLTSRDPRIRSVRDFTANDRIALPAPKVSAQAVMLQMAAAAAWGDAAYDRLDALTFALSPPDATAGLLSGHGEFTSAFTVPPYQELQLKDPAIHIVLSSEDVVGVSTGGTAWTTKRFHDGNPKSLPGVAGGDAGGFGICGVASAGDGGVLRRGYEGEDRYRSDGGVVEGPSVSIHSDAACDDEVGGVHASGRKVEECADVVEGFVLAGDLGGGWELRESG